MPEERSCRGKVRYQDRGAARRASRQLRRTLDEAIHAYRCFHCGFFHVGHYPAWKREGMDPPWWLWVA
jgi:hypothetical protein